MKAVDTQYVVAVILDSANDVDSAWGSVTGEQIRLLLCLPWPLNIDDAEDIEIDETELPKLID